MNKNLILLKIYLLNKIDFGARLNFEQFKSICEFGFWISYKKKNQPNHFFYTDDGLPKYLKDLYDITIKPKVKWDIYVEQKIKLTELICLYE